MDKSILGMFYIVVYLSSSYAFVCLLKRFFQFIGLMSKNKGHFFDRGVANGGLGHPHEVQEDAFDDSYWYSYGIFQNDNDRY
jgi:hypothetical protein